MAQDSTERAAPGRLQSAIALDAAIADLAVVLQLDRNEREAWSKVSLQMASERPLATRGISAVDLVKVERLALTAGIGKDASNPEARREAVLGFTHDAALMASAFRMGTEQSGELMAGWRSALKLNQVQVLDLGDASSLLAQKFGALPADMGAVVRQVGAASAVLGLLPEQTAAFSAVLLQAGMNKDQASGALTTLSTALGKDASAAQQAAFTDLDLDRNELSAAMKQDAPAAIASLLESLGKVSPDKQAGLAKSLFGNDDLILQLLKDPAPLKQAFSQVADKGSYASSVLGDKSALHQAAESGGDSLSGSWNQFSASLNRFSTTLGNAFAPLIEGGLGWLSSGVNGLSQWAEGMPKVAAAVATGVAVLAAAGAKALAGVVVKHGLESVKARIENKAEEKLPSLFKKPTEKSSTPGSNARASSTEIKYCECKCLCSEERKTGDIQGKPPKTAKNIPPQQSQDKPRGKSRQQQNKRRDNRIQYCECKCLGADRGNNLRKRGGKSRNRTGAASSLSHSGGRSRNKLRNNPRVTRTKVNQPVSATVRSLSGTAIGFAGPSGASLSLAQGLTGSMASERLMAGTRSMRGRLPGPMRLLDAGMQVFDAAREGDTKSMLSGLGMAGGGWAGASAGASAGAALGTLIFPGVGTAIGGALGGVLGGIAGSDVGSWLGDKLGDRISSPGNRLPAPGAVGSELAAKPADNRQVSFAPVIQINGLDQATARQLADTVMQQMQAQFVPMMMADPLAARRGTALTDGGD